MAAKSVLAAPAGGRQNHLNTFTVRAAPVATRLTSDCVTATVAASTFTARADAQATAKYVVGALSAAAAAASSNPAAAAAASTC